MGNYLPLDGFGRLALQQDALAPPSPATAPRLVINGVVLKTEGVAELRDAVNTQDAANLVKHDGLDEVFFAAGGKRFVAYGKGMNIPRNVATFGGAVKPANAVFGRDAATILAVDNEVNSYREGAVDSLKRFGLMTSLKVGTIAAAAGLSAIGAGFLSTAVSNVLHTVKDISLAILKGAAGLMGTSVPVAGVIIGVTSFLGDIIYSAFKAEHRKVDYTPIESITK